MLSLKAIYWTRAAGMSPKLMRRIAIVALLLAALALTSCTASSAPPPEVCTALQDAITTIRWIGAAALVIGLFAFALRKALSNIFASSGASIASVAIPIAVGAILLAFSVPISQQLLLAFGLPDIIADCAIT